MEKAANRVRASAFIDVVLLVGGLSILAPASSYADVRGPVCTKPATETGHAKGSNWEVSFSPKGGCTDQVIRYINGAKGLILVQAYSFTSKPIATALEAASMNGVVVKAIFDKSDMKDPLLPELRGQGVTIFLDRKHAIAHSKVMVIDSEIVLTGSFNFTHAAETNNAENCLAVRDPELAKAYADNWAVHRGHSDAF
jgi:phosphatidylserine/phosphatidylglycerophosphate/cardiolipin synthase-like enzyme